MGGASRTVARRTSAPTAHTLWAMLPPDHCEVWDALVEQTDGIDRWCTSSVWSASAGTAFASGPAVALGDAAGPFRVLLHREVTETDDGRMLRVVVGPDPVWGFASAIVGDAALGADAVAVYLLEHDDWDVALLPGLEPGSEIEHSIGSRLLQRFARVRIGVDAVRLVARLVPGADGVGAADAWLARRSATFRRNLRRAQRAATGMGLRFEVLDAGEPAEVMARLLAIEHHSWKGVEESGLVSPSMAAFCRGMLERLPATGRMVTVASLRGTDVGFILGGVLAFGYRGAQLSYTQDVAAYSIGHLLQWHEIRRLAARGVVRYDLGMDIEYKHRFADEQYVTRSLLVFRADGT
jgi:hypothetical protein